MKKIFFSILLSAAIGAKAQTKPVLPFTLKQSAPIKIDTFNLFRHQSQPLKKVAIGFNSFYDPMPIAKLQGNSRMPVAKLDGYDGMPNAYAGRTIPDTDKVKDFQILPSVKKPTRNEN